MYKQVMKPFLDKLIAIALLLLLSPIFVIVSILIKLTSSGPVFFLQKRLGKNGIVFSVYKFRTMTDKPREVNREIVKGDMEVTSVGQVLRRLKIDELPQLINVLKGEMSFIGPRPMVAEHKQNLTEIGKVRLQVRPGLSGLAQINGNIYLSWDERWMYDSEYVKSVSFQKDLYIFLKTILIIILGEKKFLKKNG